jgi:membrane-bound serine protease (ClpP class)
MALWVPITLTAIGFVAIFLELFVPAAGVIGAAGIISMIVATVLAWVYHGRAAGTVLLACVLLGTPFVLWIGFKVFPKSFVGKRLILGESQRKESGYTSYTSERYDDLIDKQGVTITMLRPSGMVRIGENKYSVVTQGELIEKDERVRVVKIEGSRIVVRKVL